MISSNVRVKNRRENIERLRDGNAAIKPGSTFVVREAPGSNNYVQAMSAVELAEIEMEKAQQRRQERQEYTILAHNKTKERVANAEKIRHEALTQKDQKLKQKEALIKLNIPDHAPNDFNHYTYQDYGTEVALRQLHQQDEEARLHQMKRDAAMRVERERVRQLKQRQEELRLQARKQEAIVSQPNFVDDIGEEEKKVNQQELEKLQTILEQKKEQVEKILRKKEAQRYLDALHVQLQSKIQHLNIELPPLCPCQGYRPGVDTTNPLLHNVFLDCASNCVFFRNTELYNSSLLLLLKAFQIEV